MPILSVQVFHFGKTILHRKLKSGSNFYGAEVQCRVGLNFGMDNIT